MIYITADIHGDQGIWIEHIHPLLQAGDYIIIAGDVGIGFLNGAYGNEDDFFDWIGEQPHTILFIDGNHENFDRLEAYPVESRYGGQVHVIRENFLHLMRGEIFQIEGVSVFAFGGGYSLDKYRRAEGISWWSQELPSDEEYKNAERNLDKHGRKVDYIVTHTCPAETVTYLSNMAHYGIRRDVVEESRLTNYLEYIRPTIQYKHHYFGHFHVDTELWRNQTALFGTVRELVSGKVVRKWSIY